MAKQLCRLKGIAFEGIYVHESGGKPTPEGMERLALDAATMAVETARLLTREGIPAAHVSVGGFADAPGHVRLLKGKQFPEITEIHPGTAQSATCGTSVRWSMSVRRVRQRSCAP